MLIKREVETTIVDCPECDEDIVLRGEVELGQQMMCLNCGAELEVVDIEPVELGWIYEDYEYDDDDDDDDW